MKRGAVTIALGVLVSVGIIALLSATVMFNDATGRIAQGDRMYPIVDTYGLPVSCRGPAVWFGTEGKYDVYCCTEDIIGQNACKVPQRVNIIIN